MKLDGDTLAKIFALKIKKWNDAAIAADNPGVDLPWTAITVAHRSDGSGTTTNFTKYLDAVDPTDWTLGSGDTVEWPSGTQGGTGTPASRRSCRAPRARSATSTSPMPGRGAADRRAQEQGRQVRRAHVESSAAAVGNAPLNADLSFDPINTSGADSYPITSPTWIIAYEKQANHDTGTNLQSYLTYIYGDGQALATDAGYAPLPASYVQQCTDQVGKLQIPA